MLNNEKLSALAQEYGCPLYVYDANKIVAQYQRLENAFRNAPALRINYAMKALSNINILKVLKSVGSCVDCVSIQEVQTALTAGFTPNNISYTPSGVSFKEVKKAVDLGVKITVDNLSLLAQFGDHYSNIPVSIRINPNIKAGGNQKISVGHSGSKFGILTDKLDEVIKISTSKNLIINGVHMHTGSDILDPEVFLKGAEVLFEVAKKFKNIDFIDFGGGFKVAYKEGDPTTDIEYFADQLTQRFNQFCQSYGKELTMIFEPGKFLVSESGKFLARVNVVKSTSSITFAGIDAGLNHLIRPMYYNAYHHIENISNPNGAIQNYEVVGYICENDTFAKDRPISEISEGDILSFSNAGAYCFSMASNYNSRFKPAEVMIYDGNDYLIRQRETIEDILKNQIEINL